MIQYKNKTLHIQLPDANAACDHQGIMRGIVTSVRLIILHPNNGIRRDTDLEDVVPLLDLLYVLIPDELKLEKAYEDK